MASSQKRQGISIPTGGFTDGQAISVNILRTWQAEIKTVEDLLDEIESENLYQVLITVNGCTLQIVCLLYTTLMSIFFYAFYRLEYFKYYRQEVRLFAIIQSV